MIGPDWLLDYLDTHCAAKALSMTPSELTMVCDVLSEMCINQPEGSHVRVALRTAIAWVAEKYADAMIREVKEE